MDRMFQDAAFNHINSTLASFFQSLSSVPVWGDFMVRNMESLGLPKDQTMFLILGTAFISTVVLYCMLMSVVRTFLTLVRVSFQLAALLGCALAVAWAYGLFDVGGGGTLVTPPTRSPPSWKP
ncbi:MAG: hypothetical protein DHS80DRAFT_29581 [Piptocephalis tieghemiana]|nr:MAG: hypothetical protein DHS80DRAFT_29581 [Piptocephalis tieghemiana]